MTIGTYKLFVHTQQGLISKGSVRLKCLGVHVPIGQAEVTRISVSGLCDCDIKGPLRELGPKNFYVEFSLVQKKEGNQISSLIGQIKRLEERLWVR